MLERKAYEHLLKWKKERNEQKIKEALSIRGARQVGKTSLVQEFGNKEYKTFIEINFANTPSLKDLFNGDLSVESIYQKIKLSFLDNNFVPGDTLIFLDEIQKCSKARTAIKLMSTDFRYDLITSGSLLGLAYGMDDDKEVTEPDLLPVGSERIYNLNSLDFEEFLWALSFDKNNTQLLYKLFKEKKKVDQSIIDKFEDLFRQYMTIGGMPEVVQNFAINRDFSNAFSILDRIISDYRDDIATHAKGAEKIKVRRCFDSLPIQLAKEFKKFQYSKVESGQTSKKYGDSVKWLEDSQIVLLCHNVHEPFIPLKGNELENEYKMYFHDTGLLVSMYGNETRKALLFNTLKGNVKGGIYENAICEVLHKMNNNLNYFHPDDNHELEFIIEKNGEVIPIEVKSNNGASVTLNNFIDKYNPSVAYKIINGNVGFNDKKMSLPHFLLPFLN